MITTYAGLGVAAVLGLGGWLMAQQRDKATGQPIRVLVRLGTLLAALGLLLGLLTLPGTGFEPQAYAAGLLGVLVVGLLLVRGAARRAVGWTSAGEAATTAVGLAWARTARALWALLAAAGGLSLAGVLVARGEPLAGVLGAALALAPVRWWLGSAWRRESARTGVERAMAGLLSGGQEWDAREADHRGAPIRAKFDAGQQPTRITAPLPPAWAVSRTEELEAEVHGRLAAWGQAWLVKPNPSRRTLRVDRAELLPASVAYDLAPSAPSRWAVPIGIAQVSRRAEKAGAGQFGATFVFWWDLAKSPHALIVGLTGGGKSGTAYVVITGWLRNGNQVVLLDPKRVEFTPFAGRRGVRRVETELPGITTALEAAVEEMEARYRAMQRAGKRKVADLSEQDRPAPLLIVVDEIFELLSPRKGSDDATKALNEMKARCASAVASIAALGRAADVHCALLCQRADRKIIEGALQNNLPTRVLQDPESAESTERHMIGLQEITPTAQVPGRAAARTQGVPEVEMQAYWLPDTDLDRWVPMASDPKLAGDLTSNPGGLPTLVRREDAVEWSMPGEPKSEEEALREEDRENEAASQSRSSESESQTGKSAKPKAGMSEGDEPKSGASDLKNPPAGKPTDPAEPAFDLGYDPMKDFEEE